MASDEDNFDIDIYGDNEGDEEELGNGQRVGGSNAEPETNGKPSSTAVAGRDDGNGPNPSAAPKPEEKGGDEDSHMDNGDVDGAAVTQPITRADGSGNEQIDMPKQPPQKQGMKPKDGTDDRPIDEGATAAVYISELHWWTTDDDLRGWVNQSQCEDELKDVTFSEHKVNGKSKGQAYVEFTSPQAATAVKRKIESFGEGETYFKKPVVNYTHLTTNPYRTLPKDAPARGRDGPRSNDNNRSSSTGYNNSGGAASNTVGGHGHFGSGGNAGGGFRGGRGGFNNRGGPMNNVGGNFPGRSFSGPVNSGQAPRFQHGGQVSMGLPGGQIGPMPPYGAGGGFRGGMMGGMPAHRGGRGGMMPQGMGPMGPMMGQMQAQMGGMPGGMGAGMGGAMNMGPMGMQGTSSFNGSGQAGGQGSHASAVWFQGRPSPAWTSSSTQAGHNFRRGNQHHPHHYHNQHSAGVSLQTFSPSHVGPSNTSHTPGPSPAPPPPQLLPPLPPPLLPHPPPPRPLPPFPSSTSAPAQTQNAVLSHGVANVAGQQMYQAPQPHYNPAFFGANQAGSGDGSWNPHGTKRQRPD
ncbi:MAG: hypothetical protein M1825_003724 [Sarcosagium campestre]|nr:MAG: hypothetical protein M1825_003724 [Sarcosagium campestre]